jgi:hypothetical protein
VRVVAGCGLAMGNQSSMFLGEKSRNDGTTIAARLCPRAFPRGAFSSGHARPTDGGHACTGTGSHLLISIVEVDPCCNTHQAVDLTMHRSHLGPFRQVKSQLNLPHSDGQLSADENQVIECVLDRAARSHE